MLHGMGIFTQPLPFDHVAIFHGKSIHGASGFLRYTSEKLTWWNPKKGSREWLSQQKNLTQPMANLQSFLGITLRLEVWKIIDSNISRKVGICDRSQEGMRYVPFLALKEKHMKSAIKKNPIDSKSDNIQHPITSPLRIFFSLGESF